MATRAMQQQAVPLIVIPHSFPNVVDFVKKHTYLPKLLHKNISGSKLCLKHYHQMSETLLSTTASHNKSMKIHSKLNALNVNTNHQVIHSKIYLNEMKL